MSEVMQQTEAIQTVARYVCSVCWGPLEWGVDGQVICQAYGDEHQGFVTKVYAERRKAESKEEAQEVRYAFTALGVLPNPHKDKPEKQILKELGF